MCSLMTDDLTGGPRSSKMQTNSHDAQLSMLMQRLEAVESKGKSTVGSTSSAKNNASSSSSSSRPQQSSDRSSDPFAGFGDNDRKQVQEAILRAQKSFNELAALQERMKTDHDIGEDEIFAHMANLQKEKAAVDALFAKASGGKPGNKLTGTSSSGGNPFTGGISKSLGNLPPSFIQELQKAVTEGIDVRDKSGVFSSSRNGNVDITRQKFHGKRVQADWTDPKLAADSKELARPKYDSRTTAKEYLDEKETLDKKLNVVADIISSMKAKKHTVVYSGAGLSTAAGINDYASKAKGSLAPHLSGAAVVAKTAGNRLELRPTKGHHVLAAMENAGFIHHWLQQNHDRLAQKAGYPQEKINEIHGAWGDHKNPVVAMSGSLRSDLYEWFDQWCDDAECCLVVGTSLAGMNADNLPRNVGNSTDNLIIIGLTPTGLDHLAGVRIWGLLDDVLGELAKKLKIARVPNPECKRKGDTWISKHPGCKYDTPTRKKGSKELSGSRKF